MADDIKAIDYMYYVTTPGHIKQWEENKKGEIVCKTELAMQKGGGFNGVDVDSLVGWMDQTNVEKAFVTHLKMFSYWNKWMFMDTKLDDVLQYTEKYPDRFVGLAGYNPFRIKESLREVEICVKEHHFKGVYVHIYGFDIPLNDKKMYPLYAKCEELQVPVSLQVGYVLEAMPSDPGRPIYLDRIALDFPDLKIIGSHTGYPWCEELISICYKFDNVYFGCDSHMPRYWSPAVIDFIKGRGQNQVVWGSNALPWDKMLKQVDALDLTDHVKQKLLRDNTIQLFNL